MVKFNKIDKVILFGGSPILAELVTRLEYDKVVFSSDRHLDESISPDGVTLKDHLISNKIKFYNSFDINTDSNIAKEVTKNTIGFGLGPAWIFEKNTVDLFEINHLLDFHPVDLPDYKGGAHYTWKILHRNKFGSSTLMIVEGGKVNHNKGYIVKQIKYEYPNMNNSQDIIQEIQKQAIPFFLKILNDIKMGKTFPLIKIKESETTYYPFLYTKENGYINWEWKGREINLFINAFDNPYPGASTFIGSTRIYLKNCTILDPIENFHPFTSGIVIRKNKNGIYIATLGNVLLIKEVYDDEEHNIIDKIKAGQRLYTPRKYIDKAMTFDAEYNPNGIKK